MFSMQIFVSNQRAKHGMSEELRKNNVISVRETELHLSGFPTLYKIVIALCFVKVMK